LTPYYYYNTTKYMDQFYTKDEIAVKCFEKLQEYINIGEYQNILEPSAGKGAFFKLLPVSTRYGIDIEPKYDGVVCCDFFNYEPKPETYLVIGNPPFGKVSSLAVKFFNKSAEFADVIAFIVPRTFKRVSIQNQLSLSFHLIYNDDLPQKPCCFEPKMDAKCCFQIWVKKTEPRQKVTYNKTHKDFQFVKLGPLDENKQPTPPRGADFVMKAYGSNCGEIVKDGLEELRPKSWHWIKSNIDIQELISRFNSLDYSISLDTVRQDSIGQQELIYLYESKYGR
jgi:hypothetical protein